MERDLLKGEEGRFFRGNLHCHSDRFAGLRRPEEVVAAYRGAGYDFLCLSDHFEEEYGWRVTDTRSLRDDNFTTIVGAELSSALWDERDCYWVTAVGLLPSFGVPPPDDHAEAIPRAADVGALVVMLHPGLNNLPLAAADGLPAFGAIHAVEIYNHNQAMAALPDRAHGAYMLDGLLEKGHRLLVNAGDAHFGHPLDRFGGWVEVYCHRLDPNTLLGLDEGRELLLDAGAGIAGDARGRRPFAGGVERRLRDHADRGRRPVAERVGTHWCTDHRSGVRPGAVPRLLLPRHRGRRGRKAGLGQPDLGVTQPGRDHSPHRSSGAFSQTPSPSASSSANSLGCGIP